MFRRTVNADSREADYACDRRTVYDGAATCLEHLGDFVLHRKPDAFDIDVHHRIEVGFSMIDKRSFTSPSMPALLKAKSRRPHIFTACSTNASISAATMTSVRWKLAIPPALWI